MERALLAYAHRSAARVGAEWFAAEFARREEDERVEREDAGWPTTADGWDPAASTDVGLIDASVEDDLIGGAPAGLGLAPLPQAVMPDPNIAEESTPPPAISAAEWARMSPGARRLYGADAARNATGTG
jgi:hypothetical protein